MKSTTTETTTHKKIEDRIIVSLDPSNWHTNLELALQVMKSPISWVKIKPKMFEQTANPIGQLQQLAEGMNVFLDAKLCDTHHVIETLTAHERYPDMLNITCASGPTAMNLFGQSCKKHDMMSIGVTVMSTMSEEECQAVFNPNWSVTEQVIHFAHMAQQAGLTGIVCSPLELPAIKSDPELSKLTTVVTGIRPEDSEAAGQSRIATPKWALDAGADYLVIGSPITGDGIQHIGRNIDRILESCV